MESNSIIVSGKPTQKMVDYATAIADYLEIKLPDFTFSAYSNFINEYAEKYKKQMYGHGIIDFIQENVSTEDVKETAKQIENTPGVYCFIDNCECIAYIGKSSNLSSRIPSSFAEKRKYIKIKKIGYYPLDNVADMSVMEMLLIAENSPYLNRDGNNGKPSLFNSNIDIMKDFRFMALK